MFDAVEIGRRISRLRKEKDMTQPALADRMGVSFQAVSNWERGMSMPDIGKLPELAEVLGVSIDELLGSGRGGELLKHVIDGSDEAFVRQEHVTLEEAGEAAPMLKPKQVNRIVRAISENQERREEGDASGKTEPDRFTIESLVAIAPFLDEDYLDELAARLAPLEGLHKLVSIAPFLSEETLDRLAGEALVRSARVSELASVAPFLSEEALDRLALRALDQKASLGELASLAPFLSEETLGKIVRGKVESGGGFGGVAALAPFLDEDDLGKIVLSALGNGVKAGEIVSLAPFLDEDDLDKVVKHAVENGQSVGELTGLLPFLSGDALRRLVEAALKKNDTSSLQKLAKFL